MSEARLPVAPDAFEAAAEGLSRQGWWTGERALDDELVEQLRADLHALMREDRLHRAGIGRDRDFQVNRRIRSDRVFWLGRDRPAQARFIDRMEQLRLALNRELFLGLFEFESHYAHYPPGGRYLKHFDSFRGAANRVVSAVAYLNENWQPGDGGELVIYHEDGERILTTVAPRAGTFVLFLSEEVPHEVLPSRTDRTSIAGWFRLNASIAGQVDPAR